jgi:hypothetical protein
VKFLAASLLALCLATAAHAGSEAESIRYFKCGPFSIRIEPVYFNAVNFDVTSESELPITLQ